MEMEMTNVRFEVNCLYPETLTAAQLAEYPDLTFRLHSATYEFDRPGEGQVVILGANGSRGVVRSIENFPSRIPEKSLILVIVDMLPDEYLRLWKVRDYANDPWSEDID